MMKNLAYLLILGSKSPRRQELLQSLGYGFETQVRPVDESFPQDLPVTELAEYIARKKASAFQDLEQDQLLITSDTVVICNNQALAKASNENEAKDMLSLISGKRHLVMTGVCLKTKEGIKSFAETTQVVFAELKKEEIDFYIQKYQPFDKAGAYGIQEWIGMIGIERIEGDYYNVMGLPLHRLYQELQAYQ